MKPRRPLSLRARLAGTMAVLFVFGMVALYGAAQGYGRTAADNSFDRLLAGSVTSIIETVAIADDKISVDIPYAALDMLSAAPDDRVFYRVSGPANGTVTGYGDLPKPVDGVGDKASTPEAMRFFDATYRGEQVRFAVIGREIAVDGMPGWVWVQVGQTRSAREAVARETVFSALVPIVIMTLLALGAVWFGIGGALRPLKSIRNELSERSPSDLHAIDDRVPAELLPLVESINNFMRRLGGNIETLKAFIADASHQMRTPLAALLAQAQVAPHDKPHELRRSLEAIERNSLKLTHLLNQLLSDATVAHRADIGRFEAVDLLDALQEAIREAASVSEGSDVRFRSKIKTAAISGDRLMIVEAMKNLIHNAIRHGAHEEPIEIELLSTKDHYVVHVSDRGPGIPANERERVFERFARINPESPGAGIGLAIVRRAIESQHGDIELCDRVGGGLSVQVRLPRQ